MNQKSFLVSIIVNSYNYGRFLHQTIDSALSQIYKHTEVIVVDDGSTDNSVKIINSYGNKIIPVIKSNGGQGSALNAGFVACKGDVIIFLDSDDKLMPTTAEYAVQPFYDSEIAKVDWPLLIIDEQGAPTGERLPKNSAEQPDLKKLTLENGPYYDWNVTIPTSGNAWSRSFLEKVLPMPESWYITCADEFLLTLSPIYGSNKRLNQPLAYYRSHNSNNGWGRNLTETKVKGDMLRFELSCSVLVKHLNRMGVTSDSQVWKASNWNYKWMQNLLVAKEELASVISPGEIFILIDDYDLGNEILENRMQLAFLERKGEYQGQPEDSKAAIEQLNWLLKSKPRYLVFWYTAFWWLDHYQALYHHLRLNFECLLENDRLIIFRITD